MMKKEFFPDGTPIDAWFCNDYVPELEELGKKYILTDYGVKDDGSVYTEKIQKIIDLAHNNGGGVVVVPKGTYYTGALFFKQGVNLYIEEGGILKGSDDISHYKLCHTRIEGESCMYYSALINADGVKGFIISGNGTIDGNGEKAWKAFWLRLKWNPNCTNKDEQRPRLIFVSNSTDVTIAGLRLQNSHFWTNHIYKCNCVKFINCNIFSPREPVASPSTDGIDIDVCTNVLIKKCRIFVNDDGIVLKGGKGLYADKLPENGINENIIIEDCIYDFCHGCLTCGSESVHNKNIILRRAEVKSSANMLLFKIRPDTPQLYEYISVSDINGNVDLFFGIHYWDQFLDLKGKDNIPLSYAKNIEIKNCNCECKEYFECSAGREVCKLSDFKFENLKILTKSNNFSNEYIDRVEIDNVDIKQVVN